MPRVDVCSDARDGCATSSDIRTRLPALEPRVSASACTDIRGNAMRWGSAIRNGQNLVVRRILILILILQCTTDPNRSVAWLREIERLQIEQHGQNNDPSGSKIDSEELVSNMANIYISSTTPARHGLPWSADEENELRKEVQEGLTFAEIASNHERSLGAIQQRVNLHG